jgi:hypothetical protein
LEGVLQAKQWMFIEQFEPWFAFIEQFEPWLAL